MFYRYSPTQLAHYLNPKNEGALVSVFRPTLTISRSPKDDTYLIDPLSKKAKPP